MNIALASISCDNRTGIGRVVRSLAGEFVAAGHAATVIAQHAESVPPGVLVRRLWKPPLSGAAGKLLFARQTGSLFSRRRFDITNAFGVGRRADIVTASSCHRAAVEARSRFTRGRLRGRGVGLFDAVSLYDERVLMKAPVRVIAVSRLVRDELIEYYDLPAANISIVPNGIAPHPEADAGESRIRVRTQAGVRGGDFLLLFIGNEFDRKGLETVLEAMSSMGDRRLRLLVVGDDDSRPYESRAGELGVRGCVGFAGRTAHPEMYYAAADAFVLPTYYEPFGMVIIEAMAAGLPVITSARAGAVEGLVSGKHGLYLEDTLSPDELGRHIRSVMTDGELSAGLSRAGREAARRFSWERIAKETLDVYSDVIKGRSAQQ